MTENNQNIITFDDLMKNSCDCLNSIESISSNNFILKECNIIKIKLNDISEKKYTKIETIKNLCDSIVKDINYMRGVPEQEDEIRVIYDSLDSTIQQIPELYEI